MKDICLLYLSLYLNLMLFYRVTWVTKLCIPQSVRKTNTKKLIFLFELSLVFVKIKKKTFISRKTLNQTRFSKCKKNVKMSHKQIYEFIVSITEQFLLLYNYANQFTCVIIILEILTTWDIFFGKIKISSFQKNFYYTCS